MIVSQQKNEKSLEECHDCIMDYKQIMKCQMFYESLGNRGLSIIIIVLERNGSVSVRVSIIKQTVFDVSMIVSTLTLTKRPRSGAQEIW